MRYKSVVLAGVLAVAASGQALAADAETCKAVRFSDVGWTDIQVETALAGQIMNALGYESEIQVLSVPVTYQGLGNGDLDIFLGNWMPSMAADVQPYLDAGTVEQLSINLENAGYGLVVPSYVAEAGVTDLSHLSAHADKFDSKIYGIEPGNDGNRIVLGMIDDPANNLAGWELVESSEAGMLGEAQAKIAAGEWVAFLGWTPHPVMGAMGLTYLTGMGDTGFGSATVYTNVRAGYAAECPNVAKFLTNYTFTLEMVGQMMDEVLTAGKDAETAATDWVKANPGALDAWLAGVTTFDGGDGLAAVNAAYGL